MLSRQDRPPPLSTGILFQFDFAEENLADLYVASPTAQVPDEDDLRWVNKCSAQGRNACDLSSGCSRSVGSCCACTRWVHLECRYGILEVRLCVSRCHIINPWLVVIVTVFKAEKGTIRCLVP